MTRLLATFSLLALLLVSAGTAQAAGKLLIVGGGSLTDPVYDKFVALAGGASATICIFGTNSSDPEDSRDFYAPIFEARGATTVPILVTMQNSAWNTEPFFDDGFTFDDPEFEVRETETRLTEDPATVALVQGCNAFWFGGGNQSRGSFALLNQDGSDTPVAAAVREIVEGGGVFGGTSAGAALQSDPMLVNGTSADSLSTPPGPLRVGTSHGLGLLPAGFLADQHFLERGRLGRLLVAMADHGIAQAVGVDEDTAVAVDLATGLWQVVGTSQVLIAELTDPASPDRAIVHLLGDGDSYDTMTRAVSVNSELIDITGDPFEPQAPIFRLGVFNPQVIPGIITLAVDTRGETSGAGLDFVGRDEDSYGVFGVQLRFAQTPDTTAFFCLRSCRGDNPTRGGANARYSVTHMETTVEDLAVVLSSFDSLDSGRDRKRLLRDLNRAARDLVLTDSGGDDDDDDDDDD